MVIWTGLKTDLSKEIFINGEPQVQICRVVLQNPLEGVEIFAVLIKQQTNVSDEVHADELLWCLSRGCCRRCTYNRLHVLKSDWLLQHHLVERPNEESLQGKTKRQIKGFKHLRGVFIPSTQSHGTHHQAACREKQPCLPHGR